MTNGRKNCEIKQREKGKQEGENKSCGRGEVDSKGWVQRKNTPVALHSEDRGADFFILYISKGSYI